MDQVEFKMFPFTGILLFQSDTHTLKYQNKQSKSCADWAECELKDRPAGYREQGLLQQELLSPHIKKKKIKIK